MNGVFVTGLTRGIDAVSGTTTSSSLQFAHHRGADVKVTDYPTLTILSRIFQDIDGVAQPFMYDSGVATSTIAGNRQNIASWGLVQDTAFNAAGVINATAGAKGTVQLATGLQAASSTALGSSGASLALTSGISTSTYNALTAPLKVVVTNNAGKIDNNFISTSTLGFSNALNIQTFTASSTWTMPAACTSNVTAYLIGGGGGGGGGGDGGSTAGGGQGGGVGGVSIATFPIANVPSSVFVSVGQFGQGGPGAPSVGAGSAGVTGSTTSFGGLLAASGGAGGAGGLSSSAVATPSVPTQGMSYVLGGGQGGQYNSATGSTGNPSGMSPLTVLGGIGGTNTGAGSAGGSATSTWFILGGSGGGGGTSNGVSSGAGGAGGLYGGGGGGGGGGNNAGGAGGKGAYGIAVIECN